MSEYFSGPPVAKAGMDPVAFIASAHLPAAASNASKSSVRRELFETMETQCMANEDSEFAYLRSDAVNVAVPGMEAHPCVFLVDMTASQGAFYSAPSLKKASGTGKHYIFEELSTVRGACESLQRSALGHLGGRSSLHTVTYCMADRAEDVMLAKGVTRLKSRGGGSNETRIQQLRTAVHQELQCSLPAAYGERYFYKGVTHATEGRDVPVEWFDPDDPAETERIVRIRSADDLLEDLDGLLPGPFVNMVGDRKVGRPAITRRFVRFAANEMQLKEGHILVFWAHSHYMRAADFGLDVEDAAVEELPVLVYAVSESELCAVDGDVEALDLLMVDTHFSARVEDQARSIKSAPRAVGVRSASGSKRIVLVNALFATVPYGEADHAFARVLRQIAHTPHMEDAADNGGRAVMVRASDSDVLFYLCALVALEQVEVGREHALPPHIYIDTHTPKAASPGRFSNVRCVAKAMACLMDRTQFSWPNPAYGSKAAMQTLSCVAFMLLMGASDYTDGMRRVGDKCVVSAMSRFAPQIGLLVQRDAAGHYGLCVEAAYRAIVYAAVAASKKTPTARSKRGLTGAARIAAMTEEDLCGRSVDTLCAALFEKAIGQNFRIELETAASMQADNPQKAAQVLRKHRDTLTAMPPAPQELAARISCVNKALVAMLECNTGGLAHIGERAEALFGYSVLDEGSHISLRNIRLSHVWPPDMVERRVADARAAGVLF